MTLLLGEYFVVGPSETGGTEGQEHALGHDYRADGSQQPPQRVFGFYRQPEVAAQAGTAVAVGDEHSRRQHGQPQARFTEEVGGGALRATGHGLPYGRPDTREDDTEGGPRYC